MSNQKSSIRRSARDVISPVFIVNTGLLFLGAAFLVYYIMGVNAMTSGNYELKMLNSRLTSATEQYGSLLAQKINLENSETVANFAIAQNMVEAKNISHVFENKGVALGK